MDGIRILLVEDHDLYRQGLKQLLGDEGMWVVGEAASGEDGVALAARACPDVVVMDLTLPGIGGAQATERILAAVPQTRVIALTDSRDPADVIDAVLAGACGYVLKDAPVTELIATIDAAAAGQSMLSPAVANQVLERLREHERPAERQTNGAGPLSEREREVLILLAQGLDNAAIGARLQVGTTTVKHHVSNILAKLGVDNRVQAAVYAARRGMV